MATDPLKTALDPAKLGGGPGDLPGQAGGLKALAEPLAAFLNPETGQATAVKPDPAGWPKAEVSPGLPPAEEGEGEAEPAERRGSCGRFDRPGLTAAA